MSAPPDPRVDELLEAVLGVEPDGRAAFLDGACGDDPRLRREVEELAALNERADGFFDRLGLDIADCAPLELETAVRPRIEVGPYKVRRAIGRGGMGVVYRASRADGAFEQDVALKLLHLDMLTPELHRRFLVERQLLARLRHPNIAHLLDGGVTDEGRPYLVMELIEGRSITEHCREERLALEETLRLFLQAAAAVGYIHRHLVVHRDLKPSNLLVDGDGVVKLLDFGVAKLLDDERGELTRTGEQLLTPRYAAPEQLAGESITTATDVFGLGALLHELVTGRPYERRPSTGDDPWRGLPLDLATVCRKALRTEPEGRYASAEELARDVERFLAGQPVEARPHTTMYRLAKFVRRHRLGVAIGALVTLLVLGGLVRERRLRQAAEAARGEAAAVSSFLDEVLVSATPARAQGREITVADVLDQAATRLDADRSLAAQPTVEAAVRSTIGDAYFALGEYATARPHLERSLELRGSGAEAERTLETLIDLYRRQDLHERAEDLAVRLWGARRARLGEEHADTLTASSLLAGVLWAQGRVAETEAIDRRNLEIRRRVLGDDHPQTLANLNALGSTLFSLARYPEAQELYEEALAGQQKLRGPWHPETLKVAGNLASTLSARGRVRDAVPLLEQAVEGRVRVLGERHPMTATSLHTLGAALIKLARYDEAEAALERALKIRSRLTARDGYLGTLALLAEVRAAQGQSAEALAFYREALDGQVEILGPDASETLATEARLAELLAATGDPAGEPLLLTVLDRQAEVLGAAHTERQRALLGLAAIRRQQGRHEEALEISSGAARTLEGALGPEHLWTLDAWLEVARAHVELGRTEEARELAARVHEARGRLLGPEHPATLEAGAPLPSPSG